MANLPHLGEDERRLAELGYTQELRRDWSGFSNFAISFSIISILAECFTTLGQAWNNGGPVAIAWGWPIIAACILVIGLSMSELVSAFPTSGGIYWWASALGGPRGRGKVVRRAFDLGRCHREEAAGRRPAPSSRRRRRTLQLQVQAKEVPAEAGRGRQ